MKINVKVIPNAKKPSIIEEQGLIKIKVVTPAKEGKANRSVIQMLAQYFSVSKTKIKILKGEKSRNKVVDIREK